MSNDICKSKKYNLGRADKAITKEKENTLILNQYYNAFEKFILNCETPMTISIQGEWGSGKTSFINVIKKRKKVENTFYFVDFDVWNYAQFNMSEQLPLLLLSYLCNEVFEDDQIFKKIRNCTTNLILKLVSKEVFNSIDAFNGMFDKNTIKQFNELKDDFEKAVGKCLKVFNKKKLLIFIDNLDRIKPEIALKLIEVLKTFFDCNKCVFILAVDYDVIIDGAKKEYGEDKGKMFFDKAIQLPFTLPVEYYKVEEYFEKRVNSILTDIPENIRKEYQEYAVLILGSNPRMINRLLNSFSIIYLIDRLGLEEGDEYKYEVTVLLFFLLCIKFISFNLYKYLIDNSKCLKEQNIIEYVKLCSDIETIKKVVHKDNIDDDKLEKILDKYVELINKIDALLNASGYHLFNILTKTGTTDERSKN